jgi:hypothetical protein
MQIGSEVRPVIGLPAALLHASAVPETNRVRGYEQIRRMRGGSQSHLMRCSDGYYYVVKFQNNPQHTRVLVNEFLGTRLAERLGLPTTPIRIVNVDEELIRLTYDLCIETPRTRFPCQPGLQFGSRYPGDPRCAALHDFLPDELLRTVGNLHDFAGMLVFDKWTCNTDGRQTVFWKAPVSSEVVFDRQIPQSEHYSAIMIDQGFCFNTGEWNFPDAPLRGLYTRPRVYDGIVGIKSFEPWLNRLEVAINEDVLHEIMSEVPPEWYDGNLDALTCLVEQLLRRRARLPELLISAKRSNRQPFPNWM